jgi:protease I
MDKATDIELIQQTVQYYFDGHYRSDVEKLQKAFHPNSQVIGYFDGSLTFESLDGFLKFVKATPAPSESGEEYDMKIVSIDVTGNEAVAKVADLYLGLRFTDYLSLLKVDGNWVIVNKMYYYEPKE